MNTRVLKEPLGFIRIIEFPLAILAFATTAGYSATTTINYLCKDATPAPYRFTWGYPFNLNALDIAKDFCAASSTKAPVQDGYYPFSMGAVSQAQFFVFTGVICFFYVLAILGVYLLWWPRYENDGRLPLIDFVITLILGVFWFIGSCAWSSGVTTVKGITSAESIQYGLNRNKSEVYPCDGTYAENPPKTCTVDHTWNYASLNVSLIAGFACSALWIANLWFIWKETPKYKAAHTMTTPATGQGMPPGASSAGPSPFR